MPEYLPVKVTLVNGTSHNNASPIGSHTHTSPGCTSQGTGPVRHIQAPLGACNRIIFSIYGGRGSTLAFRTTWALINSYRGLTRLVRILSTEVRVSLDRLFCRYNLKHSSEGDMFWLLPSLLKSVLFGSSAPGVFLLLAFQPPPPRRP